MIIVTYSVYCYKARGINYFFAKTIVNSSYNRTNIEKTHATYFSSFIRIPYPGSANKGIYRERLRPESAMDQYDKRHHR